MCNKCFDIHYIVLDSLMYFTAMPIFPLLILSEQVTLNVALNDDYTEGDLYFGPMRKEESSRRTGYSHQLGRGVLHRGQQFHGALPITSGVR